MTEHTPRRRRSPVTEGDKPQRRDEIVAAAKKVFARNGFQGITIADVAEEAGLAPESINQYFDSKEALFRALIAGEEHALRVQVAVALAKSGGSFGYAEAPFRATLQATFEYFEANPATAKLLFREAYALDNQFNPQLRGIYERFIDDIATLIVAAQERGEVVCVPPKLVAYSLTALIGQIARRRLTTDDGISASEAADFVVSLVMKGLRPADKLRPDPPVTNA